MNRAVGLLVIFGLLVMAKGQLKFDQNRGGGGGAGASRGESASNFQAQGRNFQGSNLQERKGADTGNEGEYHAEIYYDPAFYGYESKIPGGKAMFKAFRANPEGSQDSFRGNSQNNKGGFRSSGSGQSSSGQLNRGQSNF